MPSAAKPVALAARRWQPWRDASLLAPAVAWRWGGGRRPGGVAGARAVPTGRGRDSWTAQAGQESGGAVSEGQEPAGEQAAVEPSGDQGPDGSEGAVVVVAGRHRDHRFPGRGRRITVRLAEEEFAAIEAAAGRAGLTATGYLAGVGLAAARGTAAPASSAVREVLGELMAVRAQVRRFGGNVNQGVAALNSGGAVPEWLEAAVELACRAVARVDDAAEALMRRGS